MSSGVYRTRSERKQYVKGIDMLVRKYQRKGMLTYFISFMFNQLPGSQATKMEIMKKCVERVHFILTRNIVRKPKSARWMHLRPIFIGCPDFPVPKSQKISIKQASVNDGMHYHVIACVPKKAPKNLQGPGLRLSRLRTGLKKHFEDKSHQYLTRELGRINVQRVKRKTMVGYGLKAFTNFRISADDITIF